MPRLPVYAAALLLSAGHANAAEPAPAAAPVADPAKLAAAHAKANALIAAAGAAAYFTDITSDTIPTVRHERSGLVCRFALDEEAQRITIFPVSPITERGDDVGCNSRVTLGAATIVETTYATRYKIPGLTSAEVLENASREIRTVYPSLRPWTGMKADVALADSANKPTHPPILSAWAEIDGPDGQAFFTKVSTVMVGPWALKQRTSAPKANGDTAEILSGSSFAGVVAEAVRHQAAAR